MLTQRQKKLRYGYRTPVESQNRTPGIERVDEICGSGQNGTVKNGCVCVWKMQECTVDTSARHGKGGQCGRNNTVTKAAYKINHRQAWLRRHIVFAFY